MTVAGECKKPNWFKTRCGASATKTNLENKAALQPTSHSGEASMKNATRMRVPRFGLARCPASC
jgi:hypothetical protein